MNFQSVETLDQVDKVVQRTIETEHPYALDIETTGLNPWRDSIVGIGLCFSPQGAIYIPLGHKYGQPFDPEQALQMLKPMLECVPSYIFNIPFDMEFLRNIGVDIHPDSIDVSLLTYVKGCSVSNSLETQAHNILGMKVWSYDKFMMQMKLPKVSHDISEAPVSKVTEYCGRDALATFLLHEKLYPKVKNDPIYKLEKALLPVTMRMRRNGVLIDKDHFIAEAERLTETYGHLENTIYAQASEAIGEPVHFNIGSYQQKGDILFNRMGLKVHKWTDSKVPSTSEAALAELRWDNPIVNNCVVHAQMKKMLSSYLKKFPALIEQDGRIHTSFNQTGVVTGRYSSSDPNLQNIPNLKEWTIRGDGSEKVSVNTRNAFTVPEGWRWLAFDYSQIEARIAAGVTKEAELLTAFRDGIDFHTKTTSLVFGVSVDKVTKAQRQLGKKLNFLLLYGGEANKLYSEMIKEMKVTRDECKRYRDLYYNAYAKMFQEADTIAKNAYMTHSVETLYGRLIPIPMLGSSDKYERSKGERQAYNGVIQGSAGDILKMAMVNTDRMIQKKYSLDAVKGILTVHDEIDFEVSPDVDMRDLMMDVMNVMYTKREGFPDIHAEPSLGTCWGNLTEMDKGESVEKFVDRCLGERPKMVTVEGRVDKTFILELPDFEVAQKSREEMAQLSKFLRSKKGNNVLEVRLGEGVRTITNIGISIEDKSKLLLMTSGKFYEKEKT